MSSPNPYIGPRSFEQNETIYGRDRELRQLTDRLISERIVLLHAPSGAGKTSLIQAGLIPRIQTEGFFVYPIVRVHLEHSDEQIGDTQGEGRQFNRYIFSTLLSLEERYPVKDRVKQSRLARMSLQNYLAYRSIEDQREGPELIVFDQFEEILTIDPFDREAKKAFFSHIGAVLKNRNRWALFSMRSDYVGALEPYVRSVPTYFANTFHLDLLGVKASLDAIQKPALKYGVTFTDATAQKLVDDLRRVQVQFPDGSVDTQLGNYIEPVQLQVVCFRVWDAKRADDMVIDETDLASVGDVNYSLAEYYATSVARVAEATGESERSIREWFNTKLISPDGVRSQARLGAETCEGLPVAVVRQLENTHLIRGEKRTGQIWVELSHDRLIGPVRGDNQKWFDANLSIFQRQAALWAAQGSPEGLLLRGKELLAAENEARSLTLTQDEKAFLDASINLRKHERRDKTQRRFILVSFFLSMVFMLLAVFGFVNANEERQNAQLAAVTAQVAANNANTSEAEAVTAQADVQAASTQAIAERATSQASIERKATAEFASVQALAQQATAISLVATAQSNANEQTQLAQANNLVLRSVSLRPTNPELAALLALQAFKRADIFETRTHLLSFITNSMMLPGAYNSLATTTYLDFSLDQSQLVHSSYTIYNRYDVNSNIGGVVKVRSVQFGTQVGESFGLGGLLDTVDFSPKTGVVASASCIPDKASLRTCDVETLTLWDVKTQSELGEMTLGRSFPHDAGDVILAFSSDGRLLASAINRTTITIWDVEQCTRATTESCKEVNRFGRNYEPVDMAFIPNSNLLVFVSSKQILVLDSQKNEIKNKILVESADPLVSLTVNDKYIAAGTSQGDILLWDLRTYTRVGAPLNYVHKADVISLAFSPDGKTLAAGYTDSALVLWDVSAQQMLISEIYTQKGPVFDLAFSLDSNKLASAGDTIYLWDTSPASWVSKVCNKARRNFSQAEWNLYFPNETYQLTCPAFPPGE
jgi:WD40 repeat protein